MNGVGRTVVLGEVTAMVRLGVIVGVLGVVGDDRGLTGVVGDTVRAVVGTVGVERVVTVDVRPGGHVGSPMSTRA